MTDREKSSAPMYDRAFYKEYFSTVAERLCPGNVEGKSKLTDILAGSAFCRSFHAKELIISQGQPQHFLYCLLSGALRCFTIEGSDSHGTTGAIETEPYTVGIASTSFDDGAPAADSMQALEETQIILVPLKALRQAEKLPAFHTLTVTRMEQSFQWYSQIMHVRTLSADERCRWLHQNYPRLEQRVEKQYLASLLNMDRAVYSRCRSRLGL